MARAGLPPASHDGKTLAHILDTYPRDELFQISEDELYATALGILRLGERPKVRVFLRFDRFDRFVSALVFVPRDRYDTAARERIHAILARAFNGRLSAATPTLDNSALARIHYIVGRNEGPRPHVDVARAGSTKSAPPSAPGTTVLLEALCSAHGEIEGRRLFQDTRRAFPARYRDVFSPREAVEISASCQALARSAAIARAEARV